MWPAAEGRGHSNSYTYCTVLIGLDISLSSCGFLTTSQLPTPNSPPPNSNHILHKCSITIICIRTVNTSRALKSWYNYIQQTSVWSATLSKYLVQTHKLKQVVKVHTESRWWSSSDAVTVCKFQVAQCQFCQGQTSNLADTSELQCQM